MQSVAFQPACQTHGKYLLTRRLSSPAQLLSIPRQTFRRCQPDPTPESPYSRTSQTTTDADITSYADHYKTLNGVAPPATTTNGTSHEPPAELSTANPDALAAALSAAHSALSTAETTLEDPASLSPATPPPPPGPPSNFERLMKAAIQVAVTTALALATVASHAFGLQTQWACAVLGAVLLAGWGYTRKALSASGAVAAFVVGCATLGSSLRLGLTLIAFFITSSKLTTFKEHLKSGIDDTGKKGGQRDWFQVACNGGVPTLLALAYGILAGCVDLPMGPSPQLEPWRYKALTALMGAFLGYYSCCCGDTWASELGVLSQATPRLITTLRPVRRGTNGGVTLLGLAASLAGGLLTGLVFYSCAVIAPTLWIFPMQRVIASKQWGLVVIGALAGVFGSLLDSLLGATVQYSGYDAKSGRVVGKPGPGVMHISGWPLLSNNLVNLVSATGTAAFTALLVVRVYGW